LEQQLIDVFLELKKAKESWLHFTCAFLTIPNSSTITSNVQTCKYSTSGSYHVLTINKIASLFSHSGTILLLCWIFGKKKLLDIAEFQRHVSHFQQRQIVTCEVPMGMCDSLRLFFFCSVSFVLYRRSDFASLFSVLEGKEGKKIILKDSSSIQRISTYYFWIFFDWMYP
jgi:hypothetical protein